EYIVGSQVRFRAPCNAGHATNRFQFVGECAWRGGEVAFRAGNDARVRIIRMTANDKGRSGRPGNANASPAAIERCVVAQLVQMPDKDNGGASLLRNLLEHV